MDFQASVGIHIESKRVSLVYLKRSFKGLCLAAHAIHSLIKEDPEEKTAEVRNSRVDLGYGMPNSIRRQSCLILTKK